jgi:hypothetical protein
MPESFVWLALSLGECEKIAAVAEVSDVGDTIQERFGAAIEEGPHLSIAEVDAFEKAGHAAVGRDEDGLAVDPACPHCGGREIVVDFNEALCGRCAWDGFATLLVPAIDSGGE